MSGATDAERFLNALAWRLPAAERLILCGFPGNPDDAEPSDWQPRPWRPGRSLPFGPKSNGYVTVSSFGQAEDGSFRRRQGTFAAGRALMVDDVGTKVAPTVLAGKRPSAIIETSPGNQQHWFFFAAPEEDAERFRGLIQAFIEGKLLGNDPGMAGITRVGRLPGFVNGKPKYNGFVTRLLEFEPAVRYNVADLLVLFDLKIEGRKLPPKKVPGDVAVARLEAFDVVEKFLDHRKMFKRARPDVSGWREMHCPWVDEHTNAADTGAGIRLPAPENGWTGSFRCHHGSHIDRHWRDLCEWIADLAAESLAEKNRSAPTELSRRKK